MFMTFNILQLKTKIIQHLIHRFNDFIDKLTFFNTRNIVFLRLFLKLKIF